MSSPERDEELHCVQSIYCDEHNTFEIVDITHFCFRSTPLVLHIVLPLSYPDPSCLPEISIDSNGLGVSRLQMFELQMRLQAIIENKPDELLLFDLTEETREFTESLRDDVRVCLDEEEEEMDWEDDELVDSGSRITDQAIAESHMGSVTIPNIMAQLPRFVKLLHAEIVLRSDLRHRYMLMQQKIQHRATFGISDRRTKDAAWDKYGQEEIVFHGTLRRNVASIVRSGFVVPGQKTVIGEPVGVRCGATWGRGIYTSPDPGFSLSYTDYTFSGDNGLVRGSRRLLPGQKLLVCAIVMGRRSLMTEMQRHQVDQNMESGYDSHVSPSKLEYIVFNSAQILPLYVLHLGAGYDSSEVPLSLNVHPSGPVHFTGNLTEQARKHLPNGFGAARGHRFVVHAIAPVDEDDEVWGEYQHDGPDEKGEFQQDRWIHRGSNLYQ